MGILLVNIKEYKLEIEECLAKIAYLIDIKNVKHFKSEILVLLEGLYLEMNKKEYDRVFSNSTYVLYQHYNFCKGP